MSEEVKCVLLDQPDIPFETYYIFPKWGSNAIRVYYDPIELEVNIVTKEQAERAIKEFDGAIYGAKP